MSTYLSPIRLLEYCEIDVKDRMQMTPSRLKRSLTKKFAMASNEEIEIDGYRYNKDSALAEIENPTWEQDVKNHLLIWDHPSLLQCLEDRYVNLSRCRRWLSLADDEGLVEFVAPHFLPVFKSTMYDFYDSYRVTDASSWMDFLVFVKEENRAEALLSTQFFLENGINLFQNMSFATYNSRQQDLIAWYTMRWSDFINNLPTSMDEYKKKLCETVLIAIGDIVNYDLYLASRLIIKLEQVKGLDANLKCVIADYSKMFLEIKDAYKAKQEAAARLAEEEYESSPGYLILTILGFFFFPISLIMKFRKW